MKWNDMTTITSDELADHIRIPGQKMPISFQNSATKSVLQRGVLQQVSATRAQQVCNKKKLIKSTLKQNATRAQHEKLHLCNTATNPIYRVVAELLQPEC